MTKTALHSGRKAFPVYGLKDLGALAGGTPGEFEAIVAVFGNVDYTNDRVVAGAFTKSLATWAASGDPIPVIFSHQWANLDAMIGKVTDAKQLFPGDPLLPPELAANGGLWTKFLLDVDEDFAGRVAKKLTDRTLKEFSFAYDVIVEKRGTDGVNDLVELDLIEVGPTLKGMNPATALLARARKALGEKGTDLTDEQVLDAMVVITPEQASKATIAHAFTSSGLDSSRCSLCGLTRNTVGHNMNAAPADGTKVYATLTGSFEEVQEEAFEAAYAWAQDANIGEGGFYTAYLAATFPDRVVILVEGWSDSCGDGIYYELDVVGTGEETTVANPREVLLDVTTVAKSRAMKHRATPGSASAVKARATVSGDDEPGKGKGQAPEDPRTGSDGDLPVGMKAGEALDLALLGAGLDPTDSHP